MLFKFEQKIIILLVVSIAGPFRLEGNVIFETLMAEVKMIVTEPRGDTFRLGDHIANLGFSSSKFFRLRSSIDLKESCANRDYGELFPKVSVAICDSVREC